MPQFCRDFFKMIRYNKIINETRLGVIKMLKKVIKLLLMFTLILQAITPSIIVRADEGNDEAEAEAEEMTNRSEDELEIEGEEAEIENTYLEQTSIDAMYDFIENNSEAHPFIVASGLTLNEAINALDWGENVSVHATMSRLQGPEGMVLGSIILYLNLRPGDDWLNHIDMHSFVDVGLFVQFEEGLDRPTLPQTSIDAMYDFIENNSEAHPFIIPSDLTLIEAINALDWGENVTVYIDYINLLGHHGGVSPVPELVLVVLYLNARPDGYDDRYSFGEVEIFVKNENVMVWTDEELGIWREHSDRFEAVRDEAWELFRYVEAMYLSDTLLEHPNGAELYRLFNEFKEQIPRHGLGVPNLSLPFDHEHNVHVLRTMMNYIQLFESFIAEFTAALNDDSDNGNGNNENRPNLPQTGATLINVLLIGIVILAAGGLIVYLKKKK